MKKLYKYLLLVLISFVLFVSMSGCIIIPLEKYYDISIDEVSSVQFCDLRNEETYGYSGFDINIDPVFTLLEDDKDDFLNDFSEIKFTDSLIITIAAVDPSFSYGELVIRINFTNGEYAFYSCAGFGEVFDEKGNCISTTHYSCEYEDLVGIISKYYEIK